LKRLRGSIEQNCFDPKNLIRVMPTKGKLNVIETGYIIFLVYPVFYLKIEIIFNRFSNSSCKKEKNKIE